MAHVKEVKAKEVREEAKKGLKISDLYGGGMTGHRLSSKYGSDLRVLEVIQKRHRKFIKLIDSEGYFHAKDAMGREHKWKVPYSVRVCLKQRLNFSHVVAQYPWYVTWQSPKTGKRLKKSFATPYSAFVFIAILAQYVDPHVSLVSRTGYDIPPGLRGKVPEPWKWCPCCMQARRYKGVNPQQTFYALKKEWSEDQQRYQWMDRKLRLMSCKYCGLTNRDATMRRSNQPWEVRKFKKGVRRAKRRR